MQIVCRFYRNRPDRGMRYRMNFRNFLWKLSKLTFSPGNHRSLFCVATIVPLVTTQPSWYFHPRCFGAVRFGTLRVLPAVFFALPRICSENKSNRTFLSQNSSRAHVPINTDSVERRFLVKRQKDGKRLISFHSLFPSWVHKSEVNLIQPIQMSVCG